MKISCTQQFRARSIALGLHYLCTQIKHRKEMRIGIIVAMDKELAQLQTLLDDAHEAERHSIKFVIGNIGDKEIIMQKCGIGKVNSAIGAVEMIDGYQPDVVVSTGVAGGADVSMEIGDVVAGSEFCYHDTYCGSECGFGQIMGMPPVFKAPAPLVEKALLSGGKTIHQGLIVSGDWFVDSRDKMRDILHSFPTAKAVDMESCSIAQTCHAYGVPFISFRIISDIPLKDNKASQYFDFWARLADGSFNVTRNFLERI